MWPRRWRRQIATDKRDKYTRDLLGDGEMMNQEAIFAGKLFVLSSDNFLMTCDAPMPGIDSVMRVTTTMAMLLNGAFLVAQEGRWLFVGGWGDYTNMRGAFFDDSPQRDANAMALKALGIQVLTIEKANENIRESGLQLNHITAQERAAHNAAMRCSGD